MTHVTNHGRLHVALFHGGKMIETIIVAVIGSGALSTVISAIITAIGNRKGIKSKVRKIEKDSVRTQLLLMMSDYPEEKQEILNIAEYYFVTLKANWYMTTVFAKWLKKQGLERPDWFVGGERNEK